MTALTVTLDTLADTAFLGAALSDALHDGDIIELRGPLGAGKTALAKQIIASQCGPVEVPSPTFTLVETYQGKAFPIWHFDLYRLTSPSEIWELGFEDAIEQGVCLIEWPQKAGNLIPEGALTIDLSFANGARIATFTGDKSWGPRLALLTERLENRHKQS